MREFLKILRKGFGSDAGVKAQVIAYQDVCNEAAFRLEKAQAIIDELGEENKFLFDEVLKLLKKLENFKDYSTNLRFAIREHKNSYDKKEFADLADMNLWEELEKDWP